MSTKKGASRRQKIRSRRKASSTKRRANRKRKSDVLEFVFEEVVVIDSDGEFLPREPSSTKRRSRPKRRIVKPGDYILATARVISRHYLFRPDRKMNEAIAYVVANAAETFGIELHACILMSTHLHIVYRDIRGVRSDFHHKLHRDLALFTKAHRGWRGAVFEKDHSQVRLHGYQAVIDKIGYLVANPVAAGAVRYAHDWPGFITRIDDMGNVDIGGQRPEAYFGKRKTAPEEAFTPLRLPAIVLEHYEGNEDAVREALKGSRDGHIAKAHAEMRDKGWRYLGAERCQKKSPFHRAKAYEVFDALNPQFAYVGLTGAARRAVFEEYKTFMSDYDECRERLLRKEENIIWPAGTWKMVHKLNHSCVPCSPL